MQKISFFGASGGVTGSSYMLIGKNEDSLLIDFGMFQGDDATTAQNYERIPFRPSSLKGVLLTHAHLDHCGRLPLLVFGGYSGKIYMTAPTKALVTVVLNDAAKVAQESLDNPPLYGTDEVQKVFNMIEVVAYDIPFTVGSFTIMFRDAGHILGSASIEIVDTVDHQSIVFSGDLGNTPEDIVRPTTYIESANIVVMESTYGDKNHPKEDQSAIIQEEINAVEEGSGVLLIPAFSLERTQELLHRIHHLKKDGKVRKHTPIFLDSPMGIHATVIFKTFKEFYNKELQSHTDDPFSFDGLVVTEDARDSREIIRAMEPKVIIAGSGMMSGGRILHHATNYLSRKSTRLLFVGYQAEETLGNKILNGAPSVRIAKRNVQIKAKIRNIESMSSHADQSKLLTWLGHIKGVQKVILTHGEQKQRETFAQKIKQDLQINNVFLPNMKQDITLK